jgi:unsaturated rhamnogalacturonyl hydrolase
MHTMQRIEETLEKVAYKTIEKYYESADMNYFIWDWQQGVGLYGLWKAYERLHDKQIYDFIKEYIDYHMQKGLGERTINTTAPFMTVLKLYEATGQSSYRDACEQQAQFCMAEADRTAGGALAHTVIGKRFSSQIWADTLFMGALFLSQWGALVDNQMYCKEALRQLDLHYRYLTDEKTNLLFHGYDEKSRSHLSAVRWGRANGWAIISTIEMLQGTKEPPSEYETIVERFVRHLDALLSYMQRDGSWNTVLDSPSSVKETTIGSCICYGLKKGLEHHMLEETYEAVYKQCLEALLADIKSDGEVLHTSGGTPIMESEQAYNEIPSVMSYYGQGLALLALSAGCQ